MGSSVDAKLAEIAAGLSPELRARFPLIRVLGAGASGVVVEAREGGRAIALKLVACPGATPGHERFRRLQREAEVQARIKHPNVVPLIATGLDGETVWLACELAEGRTLNEELKDQGKLPAARVRTLMQEVLAGLEALHAAGVVHRDIKPANLVVTPKGVRLIDLGIASVRDAVEMITRTGQMLGTPAFVAPEQAKGEDASPAADLYSLGAVGFLALTGRLPFEGSAAEVIAGKVLRDPPPVASLAPVPEPLATVVDRLLAREPSARPGAAEVRGLLAQPLKSVKVAVPPSTRTAAPAGPLAAGAAAGVAIGLFALLAVGPAAPARFSAPVLQATLRGPVVAFRRAPAGPAELVVESAGAKERVLPSSGAAEHAVPVTDLPLGASVTVRPRWRGSTGPSLTFTAGAGPLTEVQVDRRAEGALVGIGAALACTARLGVRAADGTLSWLTSDRADTSHRFLVTKLPVAKLELELSAGGETAQLPVPLEPAEAALLQ